MHFSPIRQPEAGLADALRPRIVHLADRLKEVGWHIDFLLPGWLVVELMDTLRALPVPFSVAHMGLFRAELGPEQPGFQAFLDLAADGSGRCWPKLTGIYRFSNDPTFGDVKPFAQALIDRAPDQLLWGSDYPHLSFHDRVGTIGLFNQLAEWAPDPETRRRILVDNPARLFLFELLAFAGDLDRARKQLDVLRYDDPRHSAAVLQYRDALAAEAARRAVFAGTGQPKVLGVAPDHVRARLEALPYIARGEHPEARKRLDEANAAVPKLTGILNGKPFEGLYDADERLGTRIAESSPRKRG